MSTAILAYFAFFEKLIDQWKQIAANLVILVATNLVSTTHTILFLLILIASIVLHL